jgi:tRNA(fMet)-specific endonuclease VapC
MLDTNIISELIRNPRGVVVDRLRATDPNAVCTSIVVACALRFGARRKGSQLLTQRVDDLLNTLTVLPLVTHNGREFARVPELRVEDWLAPSM